MAFTAAQKKEMDRVSADRKVELTLERLERRTPEQLRARVNILSVGEAVAFAPESDYSVEDAALIQAVRPRMKWILAIPELLERAAMLRAEGMSEGAVTAILEGN